ncbi:MAG: ABC transporter permease [Thermodesulfobacteriota bacterium]
MIRIYALIERDLRKFIRNPFVVGVSIAMPIVYLIIIGSSFQGELKSLSVAVVDQDKGEYGRRILANLRAIQQGPASIRVITVTDKAEAMQSLEEGLFKAVLLIPHDFSRKAIRGETSEVGLFLDNVETISSATIERAVRGAVGAVFVEFTPTRAGSGRVFVRAINTYKKIDYDQGLIPGVVIMAIFIGAMTTGVFNVVMDRFLGVDESYFLTPLTRLDIVVALVISGLLVTTVLAVIVLFLSTLTAGMYLWDLLALSGFFSVLVVFILSALSLQGLMFLVLGRATHPRIMGIVGGFLNVIFFFPSGAIYPVESFPGWLQVFAAVNPETYSVHALKALIFKGSGFWTITNDLLFLAGFSFVTLTVSILTFKRTL